MGKEVKLKSRAPENPSYKPLPEIEDQLQHVKAFIEQIERDMQDEHKDWMELEINMQKAIYQSLCAAKWMVEMSTEQLKKEPGNHPEHPHNFCWYATEHEGKWTAVLVQRNVPGYTPHEMGPVATQVEALEWCDILNSDLGILNGRTVDEIVASSMNAHKRPVLDLIDKEIHFHQNLMEKAINVDKIIVRERVATLMCIKDKIEKEVGHA